MNRETLNAARVPTVRLNPNTPLITPALNNQTRCNLINGNARTHIILHELKNVGLVAQTSLCGVMTAMINRVPDRISSTRSVIFFFFSSFEKSPSTLQRHLRLIINNATDTSGFLLDSTNILVSGLAVYTHCICAIYVHEYD